MFVVAVERCRGCLVCSRVCPSGALSIKGYAAYIDQDKCQGCGHCLDACPFGAIYQLEERAASWSAARAQEPAGETTTPESENEATTSRGTVSGKGTVRPLQTPPENRRPLPRNEAPSGYAWRSGPSYWPEEVRPGRGPGQGLGPGFGRGLGRGAGRGMGRGLGRGMGRGRPGR